MQLLPTKLIGIVVDHGECPVERVQIDRNGEGYWVGSIGHDEALKLTDLREIFDYSHSGSGDDDDGDDGSDPPDSGKLNPEDDVEDPAPDVPDVGSPDKDEPNEEAPSDRKDPSGAESSSSDDEPEMELTKRRKRKQAVDPLMASATRKKKGRNQISVSDSAFFSEL